MAALQCTAWDALSVDSCACEWSLGLFWSLGLSFVWVATQATCPKPVPPATDKEASEKRASSSADKGMTRTAQVWMAIGIGLLAARGGDLLST